MNVRALWRPSPGAFPLRPFRRLAIHRERFRFVGSTLLRWEVAYTLLPILALILALDATLITAWQLDRLPGPLALLPQLLRLDAGLLRAGIIVLLPLIPWLIRLAIHGRPFPRTRADVGLLLFLLGAQIGYTQTLAPDLARARLLGIAGSIYLYYLIANTTPTPTALRRWAIALLTATAAITLLTLSLMGFQLTPSPTTDLLRPLLDAALPLSLGPPFHLLFFEMAQRLFIHPNGFADFPLILAVLTAALAAFARSWSARTTWTLATLIALLLLLASGARTALLAGALALAAVLFVALSARGLRHRWLVASAALLAVGTVALLLTALPSDKRAQLLALGDLLETDSALARFQMWSSYWGLIRQSPLLGVGLSLRSVSAEYAGNYGIDLYFGDPHSHNLLLQTYLEQTPLGLAGLLLLIYAVFRTAFLARSWLPTATGSSPAGPATVTIPILTGSTAALGALVLHNLFEANLSSNILTALLFALAALTIRASQLVSQPQSVDSSLDTTHTFSYATWFRTALYLLTAILLVVIIAGHWPPPLAPRLYVR